MTETFGLAPEVEAEGMVLFIMPNGTMLELNEPQAASAEYGFNDGLVFGFRVDDVEAASAAVEAARCSARSPAWRRWRTPTDASAVQTVGSTASTSRSSASARSGGQVHRQST